MNADKLKSILEKHAKWLAGEMGGERANLAGANIAMADLAWADLAWADLAMADLRWANLRGANLHGADLRWAKLHGANLDGANLRGANLRGADLAWADLAMADLRWADLRGADLHGADLDFSCWPLWCGSKSAKVDARLAQQLAAHFCALDCDDPEYQAARSAILDFARGSHRADDLGLLEA